MKASKKIVELSDKRVVCIDSNVTTVKDKVPVHLMVYSGDTNGYNEKPGGGILLDPEKLAGAKIIGFIN